VSPDRRFVTLKLTSVLLLLVFHLSTLCSQVVRVTFRVVTPVSTPRDANIYIAGNDSLLGLWDPGRVSLRAENDSVWVGEFRFAHGKELEYKITRGAWNLEAIYQEGEIPQNNRLVVERDTAIVVRPLMWRDGMESMEGGITGTVQYHRDLKAEGLRFERDLIVWLPPSYDQDSTKRYPVVYMQDGQNIFDPHTSFTGFDWRIDEVCDSLIRINRIREIIVVGIYNSPDRMTEYSNSAEGRSYAEFVVNAVKPLVDSTYRTLPERENTAVMGSSLGGLISFLIAWWHPDIFSEAGCLSTVFTYNQDATLKEVEADTDRTKPVKFYLDCGGVGGEATLKPGMDKMIQLLKDKGYREGFDYTWYYDPSAEHNERAWASRVWRPLVFFFGIPN